MKKLIAMLLAIVLCVSCFAACGTTPNSDGTAGNSGTGSNEDTEDTKGEEKTLVVGYTIYEPMNYKDESGKLIGFDTELAEAVFTNLGYKVLFQEIKWESKYTDLNSGAIDCVWNGFTCNTADDDGV